MTERVRTGAQYVLERRQWVPTPIDVTFAFFADPRNLTDITPSWLALTFDRRTRQRIDADGFALERGTRLRYRVRPLLVPQGWTAEIRAWEPPNRFVDEQVRGPYRIWYHEHRFRAARGGTDIHDRIDYALPLGPLGRFAHAVLVRRQLEAIFDYRKRRIAEYFGGQGPAPRSMPGPTPIS